MSEQNTEQAAPKPSNRRPVWHMVIDDMAERDDIGREKYGTPLQCHNGRNPLIDAYQEALDLAVYLRQKIEEDRTAAQLNRAAGAWAAYQKCIEVMRRSSEALRREGLHEAARALREVAAGFEVYAQDAAAVAETLKG